MTGRFCRLDMSLRALFQLENDGRPTTSPDPKGPPKLINYIADRDAPDVAHIETGKF
jgi:hypothetical protein